MKMVLGIIFLLFGCYITFQLYYELGFGGNPANWQEEVRRVEGVTVLEEVKQGSLQKHGTCFLYISQHEDGCIPTHHSSDRVEWVYDLEYGQKAYAEVKTSYLKPYGIYKRRMEHGGLALSCPRIKWVFHLRYNYSIERVIW